MDFIPSRDDILLKLGRIFDNRGLKFINISVKFLHLLVTRFLLELVFKFKISKSFLSIRNSTKTGHRFNPFFSDLDISLVVPDHFEESSSISIENFYNRIKYFFIFLGEIEIYRHSEYIEFLELQKNNSEFIYLMKDVRKLGWLVADLKILKNTYQAYKAKRAIENIALKWNIRSNNPTEIFLVFGQKLEQLIGALNLYDFSDNVLFDRTIQPCSHLGVNARFDLAMSSPTAWILTCALPQDKVAFKNLEIINTLCLQYENIKKFRMGYLRWEYLLLCAVYRGNSKKFPWMQTWKIEVMNQM